RLRSPGRDARRFEVAHQRLGRLVDVVRLLEVVCHLLHEGIFAGRGVLAEALLVTALELIHRCLPSSRVDLHWIDRNCARTSNIRTGGGRGSIFARIHAFWMQTAVWEASQTAV